MSTKHVRNAADLVRFKCALQLTCEACGNARTMTGFEAVRALGALDEFEAIRRRLKCSLCGAKDAKLTVLSPPASRN
jgi:hypothetical protein